MKTSLTKRMLAMLLVLCMVLPMAPSFTLPAKAAAEDPVVVIAGSDLQYITSQNLAEGDTSQLETMIDQIQAAGYTDVDGFLFCGDYTQYMGYHSWTSTNKGNVAAAVQAKYPNLSADAMEFVQGNHDPDCCTTDGVLSPTGNNDAEAYGVYVLHEKDYSWNKTGTQSDAIAAASALSSYLKEKMVAGYDKPIFIISHLPLHYTMRTYTNGDGRYANYYFDVLNSAAAAGLNIIYLFGHHHSGSWLDSQGGSAVYFAKGDSINIAQASTTEYATEKLNFTYMNAGFTGYFTTTSSTAGVETDLTMSVFEITGSDVKISRYSMEGLHDVKSAGVVNSAYTESWAVDTRVVSSPATVELTTVVGSADGITFAADGVTGLTSTEIASQTPLGYSAYRTYDIQPVGYTKGSTATVSIPVSAEFDASRPVVVIDGTTGGIYTCAVEDGRVIFETNHAGEFTLAQEDAEPQTATQTVTYLKRINSVDELQEGVPYIISDYKDSWYHYLMTNTAQSYVSSSSGTFAGLLLDGVPSIDTEHVWYVRDGYLVYGAADSEQYLLISSSGVSLGAFDESTAASACANPYPGSYGPDDLGIKSASGYLNRRGGGVDNVIATYYTSHGGSYWHFDEIAVGDIALSVTPSLSTMTLDQTAVMTPVVSLGGVASNDYTLTWSSQDPTVASVDENGYVQALRTGRTSIIATLTRVEDVELAEPVQVEVPLNIYAMSLGSSVTAATGILETYLERTTELTSGVASGPYVISSNVGDQYKHLTGTLGASNYSSSLQGLLLATPDDFSHLWYYDGTYFRYGAPDGPYLAYVDGAVNLSTSSDNAFDTLVLNSDVYLIGNSHVSGTSIYLNQYGGKNANAVGLYSNGDWIINKVISNPSVRLVVNPGTASVVQGNTLRLVHTVMVGEQEASSSTVTWSTDNSAVATVSEDGTITAVNPGTAIITATLTEANGVATASNVTVSVPVEVTAAEDGTVSAFASGFADKGMTRVTDLTPGVVSGPYVITNRSTGRILSGIEGYTSSQCTGLELLGENDYTHLWYYDGQHLRYGSLDGEYLVVENGQVCLSNNVDAAFDSIAQYVNSDGTLSTGYLIQNTNISGYQYLNQLGGGTNYAAGLWAGDGTSRWYFNLVSMLEPVTLSVTPGKSTVRTGETVTLDPTVVLDGVPTDSYTITWTSSDTSVATVSGGVVTGVAAGQVTITATLSQVDSLGCNISVEIPVGVVKTEQRSASWTTATTELGPIPVRVTSLPAGVSGPYLILNRGSGYILGGYQDVTSPAATGLWLRPYNAGDYHDLWYYDGQYLIYGDPNATDRYLAHTDGMVQLSGDTAVAFDQIAANTVSNLGSFTIGSDHLSDQYLNQYGSGEYQAVGLYSLDGGISSSANTGSAWDFYSLESYGEAVLSCYAEDGSNELLITETKKMAYQLELDGAVKSTSGYKVTYEVSDSTVATISKDGTLYPQSAGTVTVTAKLATIDGSVPPVELAAPVTIYVRGPESVTVDSKEGSLPLHASDRLKVSSLENAEEKLMLTVTFEGGAQRQIPLTAAYMTDANGNEIDTSTADVYENVTITYEGVVCCTDFTLHVLASDLPDYPEYPAEGSVFVDKNAYDTQNFQSSGVAQVELSTSGVPVKKGADVIIMLDTSSSMGNTADETNEQRINVLCASLNNLVNSFQKTNEDGSIMDVRVAVADFNGFYHDEYSTYYIDPADTMASNSIRSGSDSAAKIYTGDKTLGTGAFIQATEFGENPFTTNKSYSGPTSGKYTLTMGSGTNYDYAFDAVYQMGQAINDANAEAGEDRDLFVIFMSDGAPFQYNYFGSQSTSTYWSNYLMGTMEDSMFKEGSHTYYYHEEGKHWMAEAIKGSRDEEYPVIRKNDHRDTDGDNIINIQGLGATLYSIGFCLKVDNKITVDAMEYVINQLASESKYAYFANTPDELDATFSSISNDIMYAASDAYFLDEMGELYDLQLGNRTYSLNGESVTFSDNRIEARTYEIYTMADVENGLCLQNQIGVRKTDEDGNFIYTVDETVTFNATGTEAYSDKIFTTNADGTVTHPNILIDGVICGQSFWYNTNSVAKTITLPNGSTYNLGAETFYWNVKTISTSEKALNYYVYLTGSTEGSRNAGIYPTNESAWLYYKNYLGNNCQLEAPIPTMPWSQAQVGYGFYLVDKAGNPIVNSTTGQTGSFEKAVKLTDVTYREFLTNTSASLVADRLLPRDLAETYRLFDSAARYDVSLNSDGYGTIAVYTNGIVPVSTYITGLTATAMKDGDEVGTQKPATNFATANTTVWFALVVSDDTVVVDKTVAAVEGETDKFTLTLDAYSTGSTVKMASNKPSDIVLVLDQSSTMYTPVGVDADRISISNLSEVRTQLADYAITDFETRVNAGDQELLENAKHLGYYIAIHKKYDYIYIVQYAQNDAGEWGWYYVPVDQTVRTVEVDTENATNDTDAALKMGYDAASGTYQPFGYGTYAQTHADNALLGTGLVTYYQSQYGALYDTLQQFVTDLKDEATASGLDHRVAVVGFSSPFYDGWTGYDGTGIYVDGNYHLYDSDYKYVKNGNIYDPDKVFGDDVDDYSDANILDSDKFHDYNVSAQTYADALVSVKDNYDSVLNSVKAYKANYQQTCPSIGISIAQSIFAARESTENLFTNPDMSGKLNPGSPTYSNGGNTYAEDQDDEHLKSNYTADNAEDRDEIIILFTDGVPTVRCSSDRDLGLSSHKAVAAEFWTITAGIDDVIDHAYEAKQAGIQIYGIGTSKAVMTQYGTEFFEHVSSDDPTAQSTLTINEVWTNDSAGVPFLSGASASTAISNSTYSDQGYTMYTSDADMDLGKAFDTIYDSIVDTVALDETAVLKEVLSDYFDLDNLTEAELLSNISVYTADYLGMDENGNDLFSETLVPFEDAVVEVKKSDDGRYDTIEVKNFDYSTEYIGIYDNQPRGRKLVVKVEIQAREGFWGGNNVPTNDAATAIYTPDGEPYVSFPEPQANVPVQPEIITQDKTVYYGGSVESLELVDKITVGGLDVNISDTGKLTPQQSWMDDYATLTWNEDLTVPESLISGKDANSYDYGVTLSPIYEGESNTSANPSNIAGTPVEDASDTNTANVFVLEPVITWKDMVISLGTLVDDTFCNTNDFVSLGWVDQDTRETPETLPEGAPTLTYHYSYQGKPLEDVPVDVRVTSSYAGEDITHVVTYLWQDCDQPIHKTNRDQIFQHSGSDVSYEFYIHVEGEDVLVSNKRADTLEGTTDEFILTMEGYVTGDVEQITLTKPADIVLVLDHSGSMHTPVGATEVLYSPDTSVGRAGELYSGAGALTKADLDTTKGAHRGYYVAQSTSSLWWFLMEYNPDTNLWTGYSIPSTEAIVDTVEGNYTEHTKTQSWTYANLPGQLMFYKTQYGVLYDSVLSFVEDLRSSGVEHAVSIVGFAGSETTGTRIYVGGDETAVKTYNALYHENTTDARRAELFRKAMKNVQDDTQYTELLSNIEAIETNSSFTCPSAGIHLANELYNANELDRNGRDRIMILFTDGIPNRGMGEDDTTALTQTQIYDEIVKEAAEAKLTYGTTVYSVSTTTLGTNADRTFLSYASSDYPQATGYATPGSVIETPRYTMQVNGIDDMGIVFDTVTQDVSGTDVKLDSTAVLTDTITKYFDLVGDAADVEVYTQRYLGNNSWDQELVPFANAEVTITASQEGGRLDTVSVTGFDYAKEYISEDGREQTYYDASGNPVTTASYHGSKLVVKVHVKTRDGFWGGNNVPTNENTAGIYGQGNEELSKFPEPQVNVPVKPLVTAKDQTVYYGEDGLDAYDHLVDNITVDGKEVTYDKQTGTFTPKEEWMDDFADMSWDPNGTTPSTPVSGTEADDYGFTVILKPKTDGTTNTTDNPGNVAGDPVSTTDGVASDEAIGSVDILVPVITFEDSTLTLGDKTSKDYYESINRDATIDWVNQEDPYGESGLNTTPSAGFETKPSLDFTYSTDGRLLEDTPIDVTVTMGGTDITDQVYFDWTDCGSGLHDEDETIADDNTGDSFHRHQGGTDSYEFYVHVQSPLQADTVVIDFGLPVDINATFNDILPDGATLMGVALGDEALIAFSTTADSTIGDDATSGFGTLTMNDDGTLRYVLSEKTGMKMDVSDVFRYQVSYQVTDAQGVTETRYYQSTITVIPATIIYYEDNFVTFSTEVKQEDGTYQEVDGGWSDAGKEVTATQQQDRPGQALSTIDADNIYGTDSAYENMTELSMGFAQKLKVRDGLAGFARFSFKGTGFDVIGLSSDDTGVIMVTVTDKDNKPVTTLMVDTYYGYALNYYKITYTYTEDGWTSVTAGITRAQMGESQQKPENPVVGDSFVVYQSRFEPNTDASATLYQVPVMKVDLEQVVKVKDNAETTDIDETEYYGYGEYNVEIYVGYGWTFDHGQCECEASENCAGCYDFYLDAIRIYDPANDGASDKTVEDAYIADNEYKPTYEELRNHLIDKATFSTLTDQAAGIIFIDSNGALSDSNDSEIPGQISSGQSAVADYANYGPNNELYLAAGQAVAFKLSDVEGINKLHLALKSVGGSAEATIYGIRDGETIYVLDDETINTATDLYHDITKLIGATVVIRNSGTAGMLSITNLKTTYTTGSNSGTFSLFRMSPAIGAEALSSLNEGVQAPVTPDGEDVISLSHATVTFEDELKMNIYFGLDGLETQELGLITFTSQVENGTLANADAVIPGAILSGGLYKVSTLGIPAKNLVDDVWFRVYAKLADGTMIYSKLRSYSPAEYAQYVFANENYPAEVKALTAAMLSYGAEAQLWFNYRADALLTSGFAAEDLALAGTYTDDLFTGIQAVDASKVGAFAATDGAFSSKYPSVGFQGAFSISYYMTPAKSQDAAPKLYYWTQEAYDAAETLTAENASGVLTMDGQFCATVTGIAPKDMNSTIYAAAVYESNGELCSSGVLPYSLGAYFQYQAGSGTTFAPMAKAAALYGSLAEAYFN